MPFLTEVISILLRSISSKYKIAMKSCNVLLIVWLCFEFSAAHIYLTYRLILGEKASILYTFFKPAKVRDPVLWTLFMQSVPPNAHHLRKENDLFHDGMQCTALVIFCRDCSGKTLQFSCFKLPENLPTANFIVIRTGDGGTIFRQLHFSKILNFSSAPQ